MKRWESVLEAAMRTERYRAERSRLEWARHVARYRMTAEFTAPVPAAEFFANPAVFRNLTAGEPEPTSIAAPWPGASGPARVLALRPWFRLEARVEVLRMATWHAVSGRQPALIAGPVEALRELADEMLREKRELPSLRWGAIAWTGVGRERLGARDRNLLWWALRVPVHEQMRGLQGELLAQECEAKEGWHVCSDFAIWEAPALPGPARVTSLVNTRHPVIRLETGLRARLSRQRCACGRDEPRLLDLGETAGVEC